MAQGSRLRAWSGSGLAAALVLAAPLVVAQAAFDVASVKESVSLADGGTMRFMPGGGLYVRHLPVRSLITIGYELQPYQLVNVPAWVSTTYYDIDARPPGEATRAQTYLMLQALLVERFRLAFHRESRQVDGFALVRVRADRLGPDLRVSDVDCEKAFATTPKCRQGGITADTMTAVGTPIWSLVQLVISKAGAPVSDETGLTGTYDFQLQWSNDVAPADDRLSIYTALQEQLGLKLEATRGPVNVLVIDRVERPTDQ